MRLLPAVPLRLAAAAVLAAAGVAASPGRAAAGCGDYVVLTDDAPDLPARPAEPCHGPGCDNRPAPADLPLTAPVTTPTDPDQLAEVGRRAGADATGSRGRRTTPADDGRPVRLPRPIFHPPRPA